MNRRFWMPGMSVMLLASLSAAAHADSWIGNALELNVSDAEVVVRATIGETPEIPDEEGLTWAHVHNTVTLKVNEVLKSPVELAKVQTLTVLLPYDDERNLEAWQKDQPELLVCLVERRMPLSHKG